MLKKSVLALLMLAVTSIAATCSAMTFNQPVNIGSYATVHGGGPSRAYGTGYTKKTADSFVWGTGNTALTIKYTNTVSYGAIYSKTTAVYVGKELVNVKNLRIGPELYRMTSTSGDVFYISLGATALNNNFSIIGKCAGSYWNVLPFSVLKNICENIEYLDVAGAKHFLTPYAQGNKLFVPYTDNFHRNGETTGYFVFTWDDAAQWFGVDRRDV